jgi:hypothetical protein
LRAVAHVYLVHPEPRGIPGGSEERIMDTNLLYALIGAPILFVIIAVIVVYSREQHQKGLRQASIRSEDPRAENRAR